MLNNKIKIKYITFQMKDEFINIFNSSKLATFNFPIFFSKSNKVKNELKKWMNRSMLFLSQYNKWYLLRSIE